MAGAFDDGVEGGLSRAVATPLVEAI